MAELADVTFVVVGLNCFLEGEEGDASIPLPAATRGACSCRTPSAS